MQIFSCLPCMEESGNELCFISHPVYDRRLRCDVFGQVGTDSNWKGWEVWRFVKNDDDGTFIIASWTHAQKVYKSNIFEGVHKWKICLHPESKGIMIQSVTHGLFLAVKNGWFLAFSVLNLCTMDKEVDNAWHLEPAHRNQFFIFSSSVHDKWLSSTNDHPFTHCNRKSLQKWAIEPKNNEIGFTIRSLEHGKYLGLSENGRLIVSEYHQHWKVSSSPHGGVFIQSYEPAAWLSCDNDGNPYTSESSGECETWCLESIMPSTIGIKQFLSLAGIGVTTATLTVATPFAAMGVLSYIVAGGGMAATIASGGLVTSSLEPIVTGADAGVPQQRKQQYKDWPLLIEVSGMDWRTPILANQKDICHCALGACGPEAVL